MLSGMSKVYPFSKNNEPSGLTILDGQYQIEKSFSSEHAAEFNQPACNRAFYLLLHSKIICLGAVREQIHCGKILFQENWK